MPIQGEVVFKRGWRSRQEAAKKFRASAPVSPEIRAQRRAILNGELPPVVEAPSEPNPAGEQTQVSAPEATESQTPASETQEAQSEATPAEAADAPAEAVQAAAEVPAEVAPEAATAPAEVAPVLPTSEPATAAVEPARPAKQAKGKKTRFDNEGAIQE